MYLTYEEYKGYGGALAEGDFAQAELRARKRIDWLTGGRAAGLEERPEALKLAVLAAIRVDGAVGAEALAERPPVVAFATDGYSERYDGAQARAEAAQRRLDAELRRLLFGLRDADGVPLLYRGV